jgi:hypothetical protein
MTASAAWIKTNRPLDESGLFESPLTRAIVTSLVIHALVILVPSYGKLAWVGATQGHSNSSPPLHVTLQSAGRTGNLQQASSITTAITTTSPVVASLESPSATKPSNASERLGLDWKALRYYPANEVDLRPQVKLQPQLENTIPEPILLITGTAKLELLVERTGLVNAVNILESNLPIAYTERLQKAFKQMEYSPGLLDAHPVRTRILIEVSYIDGELSSSIPTTVQLHPSKPHVPIELSPNRHQRKQNPPAN